MLLQMFNQYLEWFFESTHKHTRPAHIPSKLVCWENENHSLHLLPSTDFLSHPIFLQSLPGMASHSPPKLELWIVVKINEA